MRTICLAYMWKLQIYLNTMYTLDALYLAFIKQTMGIMTNLLNGTAGRFVSYIIDVDAEENERERRWSK